jgi:hypothetical protein
MAPVLTTVTIGDRPGAWAAAGFTVDGDRCAVGSVTLELVGPAGGRGLLGWTLADPAHDGEGDGPPGTPALDGLPTTMGPVPSPAGAPAHANGAVSLDHVVVLSPDVDRTTDALAAAGIDLRRVRPVGSQPARVQHFFRLGETILELVGPARPDGDGPARFWGLAFTVADLDATAAALGPAVSAPRPAVQPGRRIATLRHRDLGISVPVALLSRRDPAPGGGSEAPTG